MRTCNTHDIIFANVVFTHAHAHSPLVEEKLELEKEAMARIEQAQLDVRHFPPSALSPTAAKPSFAVIRSLYVLIAVDCKYFSRQRCIFLCHTHRAKALFDVKTVVANDFQISSSSPTDRRRVERRHATLRQSSSEVGRSSPEGGGGARDDKTRSRQRAPGPRQDHVRVFVRSFTRSLVRSFARSFVRSLTSRADVT